MAKKKEAVTVVRHSISKALMTAIVNKASNKRFEFIAVNSPKDSNLYNVVASEKMWDKDMQDLFDAGRNNVPIKSNKEKVVAKRAKQEERDMSEITPKNIMKEALGEEPDEAMAEIAVRIDRIQGVYLLYHPEDKFKTKGEIYDLNTKTLLKHFKAGDKAANAQVLEWLNLDKEVFNHF